MKQIDSVGTKVNSKPILAEQHHQQINAAINQGYIHKVEDAEQGEVGWYLSHLPVIREQKATTK